MGKLTRKIPLSRIFSYRLKLRKYIGLFLASLLILSCAGYPVRGDRPRGVYHRIKSGETLSIIARAYHVDLQELAEINNIDNPNRIETDGVIFIPDAQQVLENIVIPVRPQPSPAPPPVLPPVPPRILPREDKEVAAIPKTVSKPETPNRETAAQPRKRQAASPAEATARGPETAPASERDSVARRTSAKPETEEIARVSPKPDSKEMVDQPVKPTENDGKADQVQFDKKRFIWPVRGKVISRFGIQPNRINNNGIRIAATDGSVVTAAADGIVDVSTELKGYGETIIIQHEAQFATVYAHLGTRAVQRGTKVKKGERIAFLGKTEPPEESYLEFEIRQKNKARNPLFFLP
jgi:lipoprotein NlpD